MAKYNIEGKNANSPNMEVSDHVDSLTHPYNKKVFQYKTQLASLKEKLALIDANLEALRSIDTNEKILAKAHAQNVSTLEAVEHVTKSYNTLLAEIELIFKKKWYQTSFWKVTTTIIMLTLIGWLGYKFRLLRFLSFIPNLVSKLYSYFFPLYTNPSANSNISITKGVINRLDQGLKFWGAATTTATMVNRARGIIKVKK